MGKQQEQQQHSAQSFQYGNRSVNYVLIRSKRRKTCEIVVDKNDVTIRAPFDKPMTEIENMLHEKIKWVVSKQREFRLEKPEIIKPTYKDKSTLPYLGINYELRIIVNDKIDTIDKMMFENNHFVAYIQGHGSEQKYIVKNLYFDWLTTMAYGIFKEKVARHGAVIEVEPKDIVLKNLKNRWGSVTKIGKINLNVNLIKASEEIIDYVIIHELCHFKIKGHSYQFWDYLKQFVPDYQQCIRWLERNASNLL